jgi:hypothetical protein
MMKNAVENINARGRIENYRNYVSIPALSPLILTSNYSPPENDTGFKRRLKSIHFDKNDSHQEEDAKKFERWFEENKDFLGILGDFVVSYLREHLDLLTDTQTDWEQKAKAVLKALYQCASKEEPVWIDEIINENTIEESKDDVTTELRSFLLNEINEYYVKYIKVIENQLNEDRDEDDKKKIDAGDSKPHALKRHYESAILIDRIRFCIENKVIPYMCQYENKKGESIICITSPILKAMNRKKIGNGNLNTLRDIANEIPSFSYGTRVMGGKSIKAAYGVRGDFNSFVTSDVELD